MNLTDDLERLSKLHKEQALSDAEFAQAKNRLLIQPAGSPPKPPDNSPGKPPQLDIKAGDSYAAYSEGTKDLRTWLVAYGIGGPILFVSQKDLAAVMAPSPLKGVIVYLFLGGLGLQILVASFNKWFNWEAYVLGLNPPGKLSCFNNLVIWFEHQFWIDIFSDILTAAAFIIATFCVLQIVLK